MSRLEFTVPVPISLNNAYADRDGRRRLSSAGKRYKDQVGWEAKAAGLAAGWAGGARYALELRIWFSSRQRRDLDNCIKLCLDAVAQALGFDDALVDRIVVERVGVDARHPRCEVVLEAWGLPPVKQPPLLEVAG